MSRYSDNLQPTYEVWCVACRSLTRTGHRDKVDAIRWLRERGWSRLTRDWPYKGKEPQWVCPGCLEDPPNNAEGRLL